MVREHERKGIITVTDKNAFPLDSCLIQDCYRVASFAETHTQDKVQSILVTNGTILDRVSKLARDIAADYQGEIIHLLCVLKVPSTLHCDA